MCLAGTADLNLLYGTSGIPSGDYITSATISVGGTVVKSYPEDYIGVLPPSGQTSVPNLAAAWDSTHFADGTPITVEVEVHDAKGKGYKAHLKAPIYNKALVLGNNTFGAEAQNSVAAAMSAVGGINYDATQSFQDTATKIAGELAPYTVFYTDTHGNITSFNDCTLDTEPNEDTTDAQDQYDLAHMVNTSQIQTAIATKAPTYPPYNFAMFDACIVMGDKYNQPTGSDSAAMSDAFGLPTYTATPNINYGAGTDRAALGWDWPSLSNDANTQWTKRLWNALAQGIPLRTAATLSSVINDAEGKINIPIRPTIFYYYTSINAVIQGDPLMTLHGVYKGKSYATPFNGYGGTQLAPNLLWFRPL